MKLVESSGVKLKRRGKQLAGLCPFHDDHEPGLIVDPKKQLWNCLGACSEGGDVYRWAPSRDGIDFKAAHRLLAALASLAPGEAAKEDDELKAEGGAPAQQCLLWLERVVEHYHRRLLETPAAQDYLRSRGIVAPEFATTFRIGYADGTLLQVISPEGRAALKRAGVITENGRELMGGCVVFPLVEAASGRAVNLYGRYAGKYDSLYLPGAQRLYLPGARRGVFNPQGARNADEVIVTESVIDAAAVWSAGLRNVMPAYGVNGLTDEIVAHLQECRVKRAALMLDSDDAGEYAAQKFGERLKESGVAARAVILPAKDASAFIAAGATADELRALVAQPDGPEEAPAPKALEKEADGSLQCVIAGREYRARGLQATGLDRLKINLRLKVGGAFHLDTLDLYQARSRAQFAQTAARLCRVDKQAVNADLLSMVEMLEAARLEMKKAAGTDEARPMGAPEREAALKFLRDPRLSERIVEDFRRCGFEGERATVLLAYLAAISRKLVEPFSVLVIARSGAGKSALQEAVCGLVPPEDLVRVTRLTGQALFYKDPDSLVNKLLSVAEEEGAQGAAYSLRTLASDQHLAIAATRTDPATGRLHTEHYEVRGPVSIIITTTSPEAFDEETRSRFAQVTLDESVKQTEAILERQRRKHSLEGRLERAGAEQVRRLHHNAQRLLRGLEVVNPYYDELSYPTERLILRREQQKYLALINAIALLHQHQREIKRGASDEAEIEYVEVELEDIALANELAQAILSRSLDELSPPVRGMLSEIRRLYQERARAQGIEIENVQLSRREIREATGWSDWQVRVYCRQLVEMEYLYLVSGQNGKRMVYELAIDVAEEEGRRLLRGLVDVEQLKRRLKEKARPGQTL